MKPTLLILLVAVSIFALAAPAAAGGAGVGPGGGTPGTSSNFTLVGANPLFGRGMNAALAVYGRYLYVGNRTDGSSRCGVGDPRGRWTPTRAPTPIRASWSSIPPIRPTRRWSGSSARSS